LTGVLEPQQHYFYLMEII